MTAQPARWVIAVGKTIMAATFGLVLGAVGMTAAFGASIIVGLATGDTSAMAVTALWALAFTSLSALIGLGVGMTVRHSAGAISSLLVWWFVAENLLRAFLPASGARFLPFDAGYRLLEVGSKFDTPENVAAAFTRPQLGLVFGAYAAIALAIGTALLYRRDPS